MTAFNSKDIDRLEKAVAQIGYLFNEAVVFSSDEKSQIFNLASQLKVIADELYENKE